MTSDAHNVYTLLRYIQHAWFNVGIDRQFQHVVARSLELGIEVTTVFSGPTLSAHLVLEEPLHTYRKFGCVKLDTITATASRQADIVPKTCIVWRASRIFRLGT